MIFGLKKSISAVLVVVIIIPSVFFVLPPKPVEAQAGILGCFTGKILSGLSGLLGGLFGGGGGGGGFGGGSVPVKVTNISTTESNTGKAAAEAKQANTITCVLNGLVWTLVNTMIKEFTNSVLDWIEGGFHGSPSFVSNPEGFFGEVGDIAAGQFITGLGPIGEILCSPFDLRIRLSLGLSLGLGGKTGRYRYVGCRLSDVQKNIYNTFTGGKWGKDGWSNWISITQPQNNAYGAYLYAQDAMSLQIGDKVIARKSEWELGRGFLGSEKCTDINGDEIDPMDPEAAYGAENGTVNCVTQTPGSVIENQLNNTLGSGQRRLEIADSINEIMDALVNQAIGQIFKAGSGLLGLSKPSPYYGGRSYLQSQMTTYQQELDKTTVKPPAGINCALSYRTRIGNDGATPSTEVWYADPFEKTWSMINGTCKNTTPVDTGTGCFATTTADTVTLADSATVTSYKSTNPPTKTLAQFQNDITRGCQNNATQGVADAAAIKAANELNVGTPGGNQPGGGGATPAAPPPQEKNVLQGVGMAYQSSVYSPGVSVAKKAIDEIRNACLYQRTFVNSQSDCLFLTQSTANESTPGALSKPYWYVTFPKAENITRVRIYPVSGPGYPNYIGNVNMEFFMNGSSVTVLAKNLISSLLKERGQNDFPYYEFTASDFPNLNGKVVDKFQITLNSPAVTGGWKDNNLLAMEEVEVWGTDAPADNGTPSGPTHSVAQITSPDPSSAGGGTSITLSTTPDQNSTFDNNDTLTVSSSSAIPALTIKIKLLQVLPTGTSTVPLSTVFKDFGVYRSISPMENGWVNLEPLFAPDPINSTLYKPLTGQTTLNVNAPSPSVYTYFLKIGGAIPQSLLSTDPGLIGKTYRLVVEITEPQASGPSLPVGTQTYTFTLRSPYQ